MQSLSLLEHKWKGSGKAKTVRLDIDDCHFVGTNRKILESGGWYSEGRSNRAEKVGNNG